MSEDNKLQVQMVDITHIRPYWRNPRVNDDAVHAVASSLKRYGFQTPMVLDVDMEIIAGHCRYRAAQSIGMDKLPCVIVDLPETVTKQLRIIDNKTAEFAKWDNEKLEEELKEMIDLQEVRELFSGSEWDDLFTGLPAAQQLAEVSVQPTEKIDTANETQLFEVPCPHCGETQTYKIKNNRVIDKDQKDIQAATDAERERLRIEREGEPEKKSKKKKKAKRKTAKSTS